MKKITLPKFPKIFFIISGVLLFIYFLLSVLEKLNIYIYWAGISTQEILPSAKILLILSLTSAFTVLMFKKIRHKALCIALAVIISVSSLVYCIMVDFSELSDSKYYEYTSDDKSHHIVVNEWSWLLAGGGRIYEKTSFCTMKKVGDYSTDDGFRPLSEDTFYFVWNEDNFELHHAFLSSLDSKSMYKVVEMEYAK